MSRGPINRRAGAVLFRPGGWRKSGLLCVDEILERRTLFDLTINGTSGNDTIIISADSVHVTVSLNGVINNYPNPSNLNVDVAGLAGNDSIWVKTTGTNTFFISGNDGNDTIHVGDGDLNAQIGAPVHVTDPGGVGNGGTDQLLIDDSVGGGNRYELDSGELQIVNIGDDPLSPIFFNMVATDSVTLLGSDGDDSLLVDGLRANMNVQLQGGDDYVNLTYGDELLPATVPNVSIDGGAGDNRVVMNSYGQQSNSAISINNNLIQGFITTTDFTEMVIFPDPAVGGQPGFPGENITFTGSSCPAFAVTIMGDNSDDTINFGTSTSPLVNARLYAGPISLQLGGGTNDVQIFDKGGNEPQNWFIQGPTVATDNFSNDVFNVTSSGATNWYIDGMSAGDQFDLAYVPSNWNITLVGQAGGDLYQESSGDSLRPNGGRYGDIDAIVNSDVSIVGSGMGNDTLALDDSSDQLGDADEYRITGSAFSKGDFSAAQTQYFNYFNLAAVSLLADDDPNTIRVFAATNLSAVTVNGGGGNDTFLDTDPSTGLGSLDGNPLTMTVIAGPGTDFLGLDDSFNQTISEYDITATSIAAHDTRDNSTRTLNFDSTLESMEVDENSAGTLTKLLGKTQGMPVTINADDGNDTVIAGGGDVDSNGFSQNNTTINGGNGTDSLEFDDHLDNTAPSQLDVYTMNSTTFGKGSAMLFYTGFEAQRVDGSDDVPKFQFARANEFDINAVSILIASTTIIGANSRPSTVILSLPNLGGALTLTLGTGLSDSVTVNDQTSSANKDYTLSSTALTTSTGQVVNYSGVEQFVLNASTGNSTITLGNGDVHTDLPFPVTVNGGGGTDGLVFENNGDATVDSQSLDAGTFTDTQVYSFSAVESLFFDDGPGGETINLNKIQVPTTVQGRGNDIVNIGAGDLTSNWLANVSVVGNFGSDVLTIDDHLGLSGAATYQWDVGDQFHASNIFREPTLGSQTITATTVAARVLLANDANDVINVNSTSTGLSLYGNGGNDQINVFDSDGPVSVDTGSEGTSLIFPFGDYLTVNSDAGTSGDSGASVKLLNSDDVYSVTVDSSINTTGTLQIPTGATLNITHDLTLTGVIDMAGGAMALDNGATQITQFNTWIKNGRKNNTWTGTTNADGTSGGAINSSLAALTPSSSAVGFAPGSAIFTTFSSTFGGKTVFQSTMLVRYTTVADASLDAKSNAQDFDSLARNYGKPGANWFQGDFNYDGVVNVADFNILASHFNAAVSSPPANSLPLARLAPSTASPFSTQPLLFDSAERAKGLAEDIL